MLKFENLEDTPDLNSLLEPKKRIFDLAIEVNGSMLNFHKVVKTSRELEVLADQYYKNKKLIKEIKGKSTTDLNNLSTKLVNIKGMRSNTIDFI